MTFTANSTNKFGPSSFVVGSTLGNGVNYTSIQQAITDCAASGGSSVYIRPKATPYVENLVFSPGVDLVGCDADGRVGAATSPVSITGSHTFSTIGNVAVSNIDMLGDGVSFVISLTPVGVTSTLTCINCAISDAFGGIDISAGVAGTAQVLLYNCNTDFASGSSMNGPGDNLMFIFGGQHLSSADVVQMAAGNCILSVENAHLNGSNFCVQMASTGSQRVNGTNSTFRCNPNPVFQASFAADVRLYHCTVASNSASTNWIDGVTTITLRHIDIAVLGTAINTNVLLTQYEDWKPYALSGVAPGTSVFRGTACYDNAHFLVTDGFVQLASAAVATTYTEDLGSASPVANNLNVLGGAGISTSGAADTITITNTQAFIWTDQGAPTTVNSFSGSFVTASITLTLPVAPVQGDMCKFKVDGVFVLVIQASGAQVIKFGSAVSAAGGTATSSADGDAVELTYRTASNTWIANSIIGNWLLA